MVTGGYRRLQLVTKDYRGLQKVTRGYKNITGRHLSADTYFDSCQLTITWMSNIKLNTECTGSRGVSCE